MASLAVYFLMMTNTDVTLYQKTIVAGSEVWERREIVGTETPYGAFWEDRKATNVIQSGLIEAYKVAIYLPDIEKIEALGILIGDVVVKGKVNDTVSAGFTITDLKKKYPNTVVIKSIDTLDYGSAPMQHIQLGAS